MQRKTKKYNGWDWGGRKSGKGGKGKKKIPKQRIKLATETDNGGERTKWGRNEEIHSVVWFQLKIVSGENLWLQELKHKIREGPPSLDFG